MTHSESGTITQEDYLSLLKIKKRVTSSKREYSLLPGTRLEIELTSLDERETFVLDFDQSSVVVSKIKIQKRWSSTVPLLRIDLEGAPHDNPDGESIECPHVHYYKAGYGLKWAEKLPNADFQNLDFNSLMASFYSYCNIVERPIVHKGLF